MAHFAFPVLVALCAVGCARGANDERTELRITRVSSLAAPAKDLAEQCSDLADHRVCWSDKSGEGVWVGARPLPALIAGAAHEYRCTGRGRERRCELRSERAPGFHCEAEECRQELPRVPDDGEWECADVSGAVLCRGGFPAAGVVRPSRDPGWFCGHRRRGDTRERVCLDLDPDLPSAQASWLCHYSARGAQLTRACARSSAPRMGARCARDAECPRDARCVSSLCLPPKVQPDCWDDSDCAGGRCAFGACLTGTE